MLQKETNMSGGDKFIDDELVGRFSGLKYALQRFMLRVMDAVEVKR